MTKKGFDIIGIEQNIRRDLDAARATCVAITKRLTAARDKVAALEQALARLAREGVGDPALVNGEIALDRADRRETKLIEVLIKANEKVVKLLEALEGLTGWPASAHCYQP